MHAVNLTDAMGQVQETESVSTYGDSEFPFLSEGGKVTLVAVPGVPDNGGQNEGPADARSLSVC